MGQDDLSQVETRPAVLDTTPHFIPEAPPAVDPTGASSVSSAEEGKSSRLTEGSTEGSDSADPDRTTQDEGEQEVAPNTQEQAAPRQDQGDEMPRGVPRADPPANYMPRYPLFALQAKRAESFQNGWPAYLNQTPYEMSSAGFFYSGNGDYCRCFYCGGGLRNWEPGDDPWVEHARWFPQCLYVKQNKGERFVRLVLQRQENNQQNAPPRQEPVLQPPPANQQNPAPVERNQLQGQATSQPNQQSQQRGEQANTIPPTSQHFTSVRQGNIEITESTVDEMSIAAVESLKVNGVSSSRIQQALQIWKSRQKQAYKISNVTSEQLMQIIFEQEDEENRRLTETSEFASALARHSSDSMRGENSHGSGAHFAGITSGNSTGDDPEVSEVLSLQNEIEERMKKLMCSVCGENEVTVAFLPCGHLVCCSLCAPAMITCPTCREPVKGNVKVFLM
ncbi:baculoviral IAP repeat-containing protein 7-like isoform X2 [Pecten maximus]|uniref:baculoviral IAP repeat-containing protein 7-like isoform X2 n=1 Tax=Pecten maximus TaxID=6579 RepID=UPI0014587B46|nr:baculoviral IAP repeat-containing protein 7-like isoform X2 [Pecten maximus]XP_033741409.1 baculoviral IAP repeat-containing protein 7-like isoform X2 [Pecten maximus]